MTTLIMTKSYIAYLEGDPANTTKRDDLVKNIPLMRKNRSYDSLILANMYENYDADDATFHKFFDPILTVAKQYGVQVIPSVHNYLGPIWGQDVYRDQTLYPLYFAMPETWRGYIRRLKRLKSLMPDMKYFYSDFESPFWEQQNSKWFTPRITLQIAECMITYCEECGDLGTTPIIYDLDERPSNTGTPRFTMIEELLVAALTESNVIFGDTSLYSNPNGPHPDWSYKWQQIVKSYPDYAQNKIMGMGIEISNAPYGYTFDEWDKRVATEQIPWSALFGAVTPT